MQDEMTLLLAKSGAVPRGAAFQAARRLGLSEFEWQDPASGKVGRFHTRMAGEGIKLPRGMKESDLYRDPAQERINREYYDTTQRIEKDYQQQLADIRSKYALKDLAFQEERERQAESEGESEYLRETAEPSDRAKINRLRRAKAQEEQEGLDKQEQFEGRAERLGEMQDRLAAMNRQIEALRTRPEDLASDRAKIAATQRAFQQWADQKKKEQALQGVYPEAGLPFLRGLGALFRSSRTQPMRYYNRQEPTFAAGGLAGLASQGRGGDTMLVHMSPDEVRAMQKMAMQRGTTMTINPETGLPEAFNLKKLLRGIGTVLPVAAALFPPLAAAMPFLASPVGSAVFSGGIGALTGEKGIDLKRGLMSGLMSYGIGSALQGLKAAGAMGDAAAAAPGTVPAAQFLGATEAGIAGASPAAQGSVTQGISNLLSSTPDVSAAAQQAFGSQIGRGAVSAGIMGATGLAALDEQEKLARDAREQQRISQEEYERAMADIAQARRRAQYAVSTNPFNFQRGGAIQVSNKPVNPRPIMFYDGGDGSPGDPSGDGGAADASSGDAAAGAVAGIDGGLAAAAAEAAADAVAGIAAGALGGGYGGLAVGDPASAFGGLSGPALGGDYGMGMESVSSTGPAFGGDYGGMTGSDFADMSNAPVGGPSAESGGDGGSSVPIDILLDNPFERAPTRKKTWAEMTPEEQEIERRRYMILKYPFPFRKGGIAALPPRYINGSGDGMSDSVPAVISNRQPARLADGEFVIPADVVSHLGNGSSKAGAQQLYSMMDRVRKARTGRESQGKQIRPDQYMPA
jgi:hypothetical protein